MFTNTVNQMRIGQGEKSVYIPKFGTVTCEDLVDGVDMSNDQTMTITGTTHTTDEAGCKVIVTKRLRNHLKESAFRAAGLVIGNAMQKKIDQDGLALYSGLDNGIGSGTSSFTMGIFAAAVTQCIGQAEPAPFPLALVGHPYLLHPLIDALATPSANVQVPESYNQSVLREHFRGLDKLYGVPVFIDANVYINPSDDDSWAAVYSKSAFIYVVGYEIDNWIKFDESLRGWEIGIVHDYAMVEEDGGYGRYLEYDSTAPTS